MNMNENENSKNIPESNDFDWDLSETEIPETEKPSQKYQAKLDDQDEAEELIDVKIIKKTQRRKNLKKNK